MRRAVALLIAPVLLVAALFSAVSCGAGAEERLGREVAAAAGPAVEAFGGDLDAGRLDAALRRSTTAFQGAASAAALRDVQRALASVLGRCRSRQPARTEWLDAPGDPPRARAAVLAVDAAFEKGAAVIRARVELDVARSTWLVDGYEVRNDAFTWTFRAIRRD